MASADIALVGGFEVNHCFLSKYGLPTPLGQLSFDLFVDL